MTSNKEYEMRGKLLIHKFFKELDIPYEGVAKEGLEKRGVKFSEDFKPVPTKVWESIVKKSGWDFITLNKLDIVVSDLQETGRYDPRLGAGIHIEDVKEANPVDSRNNKKRKEPTYAGNLNQITEFFPE